MPSLEEQIERVATLAIEEYKREVRAEQARRAREWRSRNPGSHRNRSKRFITSERLERVRALAAEGLTQAQVGDAIGVSRPEAGRIMRDYGIARRPAGGQWNAPAENLRM